MTTTIDTAAWRARAAAPARRQLEGEGFEVRRPIPTRGLEAVGPFIMLDHFGPVDYAPGEAKGAPTHPHAGIETLTYLLEGRGRHLDSLGNSSVMGPGDAQWMRAGRGIIHDEGADATFQKTGGRNHGVQLWLNMPAAHRHDAPAYRQFDAAEIPTFQVGGATVRLLAGELEGRTGPLDTLTSPFLAHVTIAPSAEVRLPIAATELAAYVLTDAGLIAGAGARDGVLVTLEGGGDLILEAGDKGMDVMILGGPPLDAPIVRYGPFVMNTEAELIGAIDAYNAGRFGRIQRETGVSA